MTDGKCPKCGAGEGAGNRDAAGNEYRWFTCNSTIRKGDGKMFLAYDCLRRQLAAATERAEKAEARAENLEMQACVQAQEARTQRPTVLAAYQAITGATGEPGDWNGAKPIRALVAERDALRAAITAVRSWRDDYPAACSCEKQGLDDCFYCTEQIGELDAALSLAPAPEPDESDK